MFVFRNYTIENLFPEGTLFSGYGDISFIPTEEKELVWFYQAPIGFENNERSSEVDSFAEKLNLIVNGLTNSQKLYICSLINPFPVNYVLSDIRIEQSINQFNTVARSLANKDPRVRFIDVSEYFSKYPISELINWRFYFISQMIIAPAVVSGFAEWFHHRKAQIDGYRKKCIVLDLDNTLWGGVLGEDGISGIKIGGDYPGNAFLYFQQGLIDLAKTGVILTVCSKNNEADVLEAWEKNPFIKLSKKHLAAWRINWENKADNIRALADELNIGLDSMVFIDDNPTERELVRQQLPVISVPEFPQKPYLLPAFLSDLVKKYFLIEKLTDEDLTKTAQYKANAERAAASRQFTDLSDFIRSLDIKISFGDADEFTIPRIAQMTQKTNQFNLTTHRYTEADIQQFVKRGDLVLWASVADKFGDNGITGAAVISVEGINAHIDTFLLSCRILGKGIENAIFNSILNKLYIQGVKKVSAEYIPTAKNPQVAKFYDNQGFSLIDETEDGHKTYIYELNGIKEISDLYKIN